MSSSSNSSLSSLSSNSSLSSLSSNSSSSSGDNWTLTVVTTTPGESFKIVLGGTTVNIDVIWGDLSSDNYTTAGAKTHTFAAAGTYYVKISGSLTGTGFIIFYTLVGNTSSKIKATTPITSVTGITTALNMFRESGLTSLPNELFKDCTSIGSTNVFTSAFRGCTGLTSLPSDLFRYNTGITDIAFHTTFESCSGLTSLPSDLFRYNTGITNSSFYFTFKNCVALTNIPSDLFEYNINAKEFYNTFYGCTGLTSIPAGLFTNNVNVTGYVNCFNACTNLQGPAPELWNLIPEPTGTDCFTNDVNLSNYGDIPVDWGGGGDENSSSTSSMDSSSSSLSSLSTNLSSRSMSTFSSHSTSSTSSSSSYSQSSFSSYSLSSSSNSSSSLDSSSSTSSYSLSSYSSESTSSSSHSSFSSYSTQSKSSSSKSSRSSLSSSSSSSSSWDFSFNRTLPFMFEEETNNPIWCLAYNGTYIFAGTGDGRILRSQNGYFWDEYYITNDINVKALYVYGNNLYAGTSPNGYIYISDLSTNETTLSQSLSLEIKAFVNYKNNMYVFTTNPSTVYKYNSNLEKWELIYGPYASNIYKITIYNNEIWILINSCNIIKFNGASFTLG